jgi:protein-tyrosine phosphatase
MSPDASSDLATPHARHIVLEEAVNFRDLGGYATADGRHVRWRTLYRADGLSRLTPGDYDVLRDLGVTTVLDLRSTAEFEMGSFPIETFPVSFHHLPIVEEMIDPRKYRLAPGKLGERYEEMARLGSGQIATALGILADPASHPAVFHCAIGKDRTGILAAVTLALLGVPDETIVADYVLSEPAIMEMRARWRTRNPTLDAELDANPEAFSAAPTNISGLFARLRAEYGSIEGYTEAAGAGPELVDQLRETLLD